MQPDARTFTFLLTASLMHCVPSVSAREAPTPAQLTIVAWNVENLFDTVDDPGNPGDDEYLPDGFRQWTEARYQKKQEHLTDVLAPVRADMIGLCEVENLRVLKDLRSKLEKRTGITWPHIVHREGPDHRGIDVAILSRFELVDIRWITPVPEQRDLLCVDFAPGAAPLTVCMNHWKSRHGAAHQTLVLRHRQARALRKEIDRLLVADANRSIVVMGDFNDDYEDASVVLELKASPDRQHVRTHQEARFLYNLHGDLRHGRDGTYYDSYSHSWHTFDSISISVGMLSGRKGCPWALMQDSYAVLDDGPMAGKKGRPSWFRKVRDPNTGLWEYHEGYSDHYPVRVKLRLTEK